MRESKTGILLGMRGKTGGGCKTGLNGQNRGQMRGYISLLLFFYLLLLMFFWLANQSSCSGDQRQQGDE